MGKGKEVLGKGKDLGQEEEILAKGKEVLGKGKGLLQGAQGNGTGCSSEKSSWRRRPQDGG